MLGGQAEFEALENSAMGGEIEERMLKGSLLVIV